MLRNKSVKCAISMICIGFSAPLFAAQLLNLKDEKLTVLQSFTQSKKRSLNMTGSNDLKVINQYTDQNQVTHTRLQQYYHHYPVLDAQAVVHAPAKHAAMGLALFAETNDKSMNGKLYQQLDTDLAPTRSIAVNQQNVKRAEQATIDNYITQHQGQRLRIENAATKTMIVIDKKDGKAHWAYEVSFFVPAPAVGKLPAKPVYVVDAETFKVYRHWNNIKTATPSELVQGGGLGGNALHGKIYYDGAKGHLASYTVTREAGMCALQNTETLVTDARTGKTMQYVCAKPNPEHNNVYWAGDFDTVNQAYSPANDAMFDAQVIEHMYKQWYSISPLINADGTNMVLHMNVHIPKMDNAYWDGNMMSFGDGIELYPLTSLEIGAHEVSHGFTEHHSNLDYDGQSGGMNEAFSDMAGETAEYFATGKARWAIGADIFKIADEAMRFMDQPSKDCYGKAPGTFCSIDRADQYYQGLDVHYSSGVYNRAFYLLSTTRGWTPKKAFAVMLHANASYWLSGTTFTDGAACTVKAAEDLGYDKVAVVKAFAGVGIEINESCTN